MCVVGSYSAVDKMITISYYIKCSEIKVTLGVKIVLLNNVIHSPPCVYFLIGFIYNAMDFGKLLAV
ncbi:hypothetical protein SOASR029_06380 [Budvicia aquatica]|nr:hypothetical protein SOASR029_06380 [Budvicia aquatica]